MLRLLLRSAPRRGVGAMRLESTSVLAAVGKVADTELFVRGLPKGVTSEELRLIFEDDFETPPFPVGVSRVAYSPKKGHDQHPFGFVTVQSNIAEEVCRIMTGYNYEGSVLTVELATPPKKPRIASIGTPIKKSGEAAGESLDPAKGPFGEA
ncbi:hypothetical protein M885DRAFT_621546 [Pelagophyceae sp. CCMP2097]|nr:hypothetical protein M885DRAFT_621546 [Pelagophyceae sp. CCMP2097]